MLRPPFVKNFSYLQLINNNPKSILMQLAQVQPIEKQITNERTIALVYGGLIVCQELKKWKT